MSDPVHQSAPESAEVALSFDNVSKAYDTDVPGAPRYALQNATFRVPSGRRIAVVGRSGSGKSTLLHLAAGIDVPTSGHVGIRGRDLGGLSEAERTRVRRHDVGLVFQFFHLLPHLSVIDNILLPAWIAGDGRAGDRAADLLSRVGLADRASDPVQQLSGGEMQRVAICRALLQQPGLLLADEPTGNLDDAIGANVMDLLMTLTDEAGTTLVYVTHSRDFARLADEVWEIHSGTVDLSDPAT
jgi:ABC-type lipoprotein export system ATPase subunit